MIGRYDLIELLNKYNINGEKLVGKNSNVLEYGEYKEIEEIIKFLLSVGFKPNMIEKCPSIISWNNADAIKDNYNWFINETKITFDDLSKCLYVLGGELNEMKKIYSYVLSKYGIETLKKCLTILQGNYLSVVSLTKNLENTIGLDIVKNNGGYILYNTTSDELTKILTIPYFNYNQNTKTYNSQLLTVTTFKRTRDEIVEILRLPYWKEEKYKPLLTPNIWNKTATQIEEILKLPYWEEERFKPLLKPTIWNKTATQIKKILKLKCWNEEKFRVLLTSNMWLKDTTQIKKILNLPYWKEERFKPLLTSTVWQKDAFQIEEILKLPYWEEERFAKLLIPSLWRKTAVQISDNIKFCNSDEELCAFANNPTLIFRVTINELVAKTNYLRANNIPVTINGKINSIYGMSNTNMQKRYGISKKELIRDYLTIKPKKL